MLRGPYSRGLSWPVTLIGVSAAVLLLAGYIPVPFEIIKRRGRVVGIDFVFLSIDWLGAFFSLMAIGKCIAYLLFAKLNGIAVGQNSFDVLGGIMYTSCAAIEAGIVISQLVWLYRTREIRRQIHLPSIYALFTLMLLSILIGEPKLREWHSKIFRKAKSGKERAGIGEIGNSKQKHL